MFSVSPCLPWEILDQDPLSLHSGHSHKCSIHCSSSHIRVFTLMHAERERDGGFGNLIGVSIWRWAFNQKMCIESQLWVGQWGHQSRSFIAAAPAHPHISASHWLEPQSNVYCVFFGSCHLSSSLFLRPSNPNVYHSLYMYIVTFAFFFTLQCNSHSPNVHIKLTLSLNVAVPPFQPMHQLLHWEILNKCTASWTFITITLQLYLLRLIIRSDA